MIQNLFTRPCKLLAAIALGLGTAATADDGHKHGAPLHGGSVKMTKEYHFEAVFTGGGVTLYPRTHGDKPLDTSKVTATATFLVPGSTKPLFAPSNLVPPAAPGQRPTSLAVAVDLGKVPAAGTTVEFKVAGLPEAGEPTATFQVPFAPAKTAEIISAKATAADARAVAAQKTCPVSKEALDSMGGPLKVTRGDRSVFLCCKSCLKDLRADPDKYLGVVTAPPAAPKAADGHGDHKH